MSTLYQKMFKEKKKKEYTGPPRPNLMSQAKEIKEVHLTLESLQFQLLRQQEEIHQLKTKLNQSNYRVEQLTIYLQNAKKASK